MNLDLWDIIDGFKGAAALSEMSERGIQEILDGSYKDTNPGRRAKVSDKYQNINCLLDNVINKINI